MGFLKDLDFTKDEILQVENNITDLVMNELISSRELVLHNIKFLKNLGVENYKDVFINFSGMFLMDPSKFAGVFNKYNKEDLISKIKDNVAIVEFL